MKRRAGIARWEIIRQTLHLRRPVGCHAFCHRVNPSSFFLSLFLDLCYVDTTPGAVEEAGAANDVSGEQLMGGLPADAASPPPGELWLGLGSLLSCLIERNLRLVIDSTLA